MSANLNVIETEADALSADRANAVISSSSGESFDMDAWYCVMAKPRQEQFAKTHLIRQGMEAFLPMLKTRNIRHRNERWSVGPLFPRYLFVRPGAIEAFTCIRSTLGVASIVSFGGKAAEVPLKIIESIRQRCVEDFVVLEESGFHKGEPVSIVGGPYEGMRAIFDAETPREERVIILLEIMASVAKVSIERRFLVHESAAT